MAGVVQQHQAGRVIHGDPHLGNYTVFRDGKGEAGGINLLDYGCIRIFSPTFVAVVTLGEPVGSAVLAWIFFDESFALLQGIGFLLLLLGIYLAARAEGR